MHVPGCGRGSEAPSREMTVSVVRERGFAVIVAVCDSGSSLVWGRQHDVDADADDADDPSKRQSTASSSRAFGDNVNDGGPATGFLNGKQISVTSAVNVNVPAEKFAVVP